MKIGISFLLIFLVCVPLFARTYEGDTINKRKLNTFIIIGSAAYGSSLIGLNSLWYNNQKKEKFHFFNDNSEWRQVDKVGHFYSAFQISEAGTEVFKWIGYSDRKSILLGSLLGFISLTPIEIFDGFSAEYGASWGDLIANTTGSFLMLGQYLIWKKTLIKPKFSFHFTSYPQLRPATLGGNYPEQILKDYNGQTYWLTFNLSDIFSKESNYPKWLDIAVGYGASNMVYWREDANLQNGFRSHRQYYLSVDFDLSNIKTKNKALKLLLYVVDMVHLPAPTLEFRKNKIVFYSFYF